MEAVCLNEDILVNIANAIRNVNHSSEQYTPGEMSTAINNLFITITQQPQDQTSQIITYNLTTEEFSYDIGETGTATFIVNASAPKNYNLTYQWQMSADGYDWKTYAGVGSLSGSPRELVVPDTIEYINHYYRCFVSDQYNRGVVSEKASFSPKYVN